jgi:predicted metal-dependent hydrolase
MEFHIIKNHRSKRLRLRVKMDGTVVVTAPSRTSVAVCERFVNEHTEWIRTALQKVAIKQKELESHKEQTDGKIHYLGKLYDLCIDSAIKDIYIIENDTITLRQEQTEYFFRTEARRIIEVRCAEIAPFYGAEYKKIRIGFQKSRWGSCSTSGTLSFNANLIKAPHSILEYVIIHEICHIIHPNHSNSYWNEVSKLCPDYKIRRKWLKNEGHKLAIS